MSGHAASEVAFLSRALKAPRVRERASALAERAREGEWSYEEYLAAVLGEEVAARESHGGEARVKAARFPAVKTLDDFDFAFARSVKREAVLHLAQLDFLAEHMNVIFLGPRAFIDTAHSFHPRYAYSPAWLSSAWIRRPFLLPRRT